MVVVESVWACSGSTSSQEGGRAAMVVGEVRSAAERKGLFEESLEREREEVELELVLGLGAVLCQ